MDIGTVTLLIVGAMAALLMLGVPLAFVSGSIAAVLAEETQAVDFNVAVRTVQPGNTLWAIARERYGEGILYVAVFEANKDLIRDPDLIYPGQIFRLPEIEQ